MVDIKKLKRVGKGTPPPAAVPTRNNLSKPATGQKVPLQVKISSELRREVRAYAAEHEVELSALFENMWQHYRQSRG
jgi:hypothetical protein